MNDTELEARLDRLEALNLELREQLTLQAEQHALDVARLERALTTGGAELIAAVIGLRAHLVDLTLDGYYPTRMPPLPVGRGVSAR